MVRRGAWVTGVRALRDVHPDRIGVGLHLDLTWSLEGKHSEQSLSSLIARSYLRLLKPQTARQEIRSQLSRFEDALGRAPAFVDGHRHVHQLPVVREMLVAELAERYGSRSPWIRSTRPSGGWSMATAKARVIHSLGGEALLEHAARHGIAASHCLLGVYGFTGDANAYRARLESWIGECSTGDVLMCHPSLKDTPGDPIGAARRNEYAVLGNVNFPFETRHGPVTLAPRPG